MSAHDAVHGRSPRQIAEHLITAVGDAEREARQEGLEGSVALLFVVDALLEAMDEYQIQFAPASDRYLRADDSSGV